MTCCPCRRQPGVSFKDQVAFLGSFRKCSPLQYVLAARLSVTDVQLDFNQRDILDDHLHETYSCHDYYTAKVSAMLTPFG